MALPLVLLVALVALLIAVGGTLLALNLVGTEKRILAPPEHRYAIGSPPFLRSMGVLLGPPLVEGNRIEPLVNGDRIFPAMLDAIRDARTSIAFETFIYWEGGIGQRFAEALAERARAGVAVRVVLDWVGCQRMDRRLLDAMAESGVEFRWYRPLRWYHLARLNHRTHRKLLVIDGRLGFTGGVGIADEWCGNAQDPDHWRDTHYRLQGPAVAQMQAAFTDNWTRITGEVLHGDEWFPTLEPAGDQCAQVFMSSSEGGAESMHLLYLLAISAATERIDLAMAYFVPDAAATEALLQALRRGVRVRVLLPGRHIDKTIVRRASRSTWGPLLAAGAEIHEFQPTMFHCKALLVDGCWVSVGSTNFDARSFRLNDEVSLNVLDHRLAAELTAHFEADLARARRITYQAWLARPWPRKLQERVAGWLAPQL